MNRRFLNRFRRNAVGSVVVEFALLLPVYIAMIFGIMEYGRLIWTRNTMEFAAQTAARYGAITSGATNATVAAYALTQLLGISSTGITFTATVAASSVTVVGTTSFSSMISAYVPIPTMTVTVTAVFAK